jgi:mercuric reductase
MSKVKQRRRYDLIILGNGAAAFAAAIKADELGKSALMIQGGTIGGTCVNVGCVPSKRMLVAGEVIKNTFEHDLGRGAIARHNEKFDFSKILRSKDQIVRAFRKEKYERVLRGLSNVDVIRGFAEFVSRNEVKVRPLDDASGSRNKGGKVFRGKNFLVATGSSPTIPPFPGIEKVRYWTNVEALSPPRKPESLIVIGGRALGLEFAQMYARFGTNVTLLQRSKTIIPDEEPEIAEALTKYLRQDGVRIVTRVTIKGISEEGRGGKGARRITVEADARGKNAKFEAVALLLATGRSPNSLGLGLEKIGVKTQKNSTNAGAIIVNDEMRTNVPNIFAAGDVTGEPMLEGLAAREGTIAAENALTGGHGKVDIDFVPRAIFTDPQFATVGLTDAEAVRKGYECNCKILSFDQISKARVIGDTRGVIKMVADERTHRILGIHILSRNAAELIHEASLIVKNKYTLEDVVNTIHVFPTLSESIKIVAQSYFRDVGATSCCI